MSGIFDQFRQKVVSSVWKEKVDERKVQEIDDKIALGVLLWAVAEADEKFLPEEEAKIKEVLTQHAKISAEPHPSIPIFLAEVPTLPVLFRNWQL